MYKTLLEAFKYIKWHLTLLLECLEVGIWRSILANDMTLTKPIRESKDIWQENNIRNNTTI